MTTTAMQLNTTYEATVKLREGTGYSLRDGAKEWNGKRVLVVPLWLIDQTERSEYVGEIACNVKFPTGWPFGWIASGDLVDIKQFG